MTENANATDEKKYPHTVKNVSDEEGSVKRYTVEIGPEVLEEELKDIYKNLRKNVSIEGFRRGKAPVRLLKSRFGKDAEKEAVNTMASGIASELIEKDDLDAVGEPSLNESTVEDGKPIVLEIDIEVMPKVEAEGYTGQKYEVEFEPVTDEMVEDQVKQIQEANATYEELAKARGFKKGDGATLDIEVTDKDGKPMESLCQEGVFMRDPYRNLMSEVAEALEGKKAGETIEQTVERTVKNREGEEVTHADTYKVTIKEIKQRVLPELDDEFAKDLGDFESMKDLRDRIRKDMEEQADQRKRQAVMDQILEHLVEKNPFDPPRSVVTQQEYQTMMRDMQQMQQMGMSLEALGMNTEQYMQSARSNAERFVKASLLLRSISEKEKIETDDKDIDAEIERIAEQEGRKPLAIRARLEAEKELDSMRQRLHVNKVEDFLMENNEIVEIAPKKDEDEKPAKKTAAKKTAKKTTKKTTTKKTAKKKTDEEE